MVRDDILSFTKLTVKLRIPIGNLFQSTFGNGVDPDSDEVRSVETRLILWFHDAATLPYLFHASNPFSTLAVLNGLDLQRNVCTIRLLS